MSEITIEAIDCLIEALPDDLQAELVQASEGGQVTAVEGSVGHVEVFRMGGMA